MKFSAAQRQRILEKARSNIDPEKLKQEKAELARRLMDQPVTDPLVQWRRDGEDQKMKRLLAKRFQRAEEQRQVAAVAAAHAVDYQAWIEAQLKAQRDFMVECVGGALGHIAETLRQEFEDKLVAVNRELRNEKAAHDRFLEQLKNQFGATIKLHIRELAITNQQVKALTEQVNALQSILHQKRQGEQTRAELHSEFTELKNDIKRKFDA
jgi:hypothetical protein